MLFNSLEFLVFALLFFCFWPLFRIKNSTRWAYLVVASFVFYGWWDWRFLFLIVFSGFIDFYCGLFIHYIRKGRKFLLGVSIFANLGLLSIFKYSHFFASVLEDTFNLVGLAIDLKGNIPEFTLILPVGISFYTFQSLSYTIDIYRKRLTPTKNLLHFFSYLAMFPQLVAGPIVRAKDFLKQLEGYKIASPVQKWHALKLISFGLFQKMVIADNLSFFIDSAFERKTVFDGSLYWWLVMFAFSFQIYCDFSGYTLIARGLAKYMGYHFKINFHHPYLARSLKEFWARWHISLSTWFRDYVYIPLGGSKRGPYRMMFALSITMLLSGLWHGANYTFIAWALIHTSILLIEKLFHRTGIISYNSALLIPITFVQVLIGWIYFRATDITQANGILFTLFKSKPSSLEFITAHLNALIFLTLAVLIELVFFIRYTYPQINVVTRKYNLDILIVVGSLLCIIFFRGEGEQFIYFQF